MPARQRDTARTQRARRSESEKREASKTCPPHRSPHSSALLSSSLSLLVSQTLERAILSADSELSFQRKQKEDKKKKKKTSKYIPKKENQHIHTSCF